jgi:hypothetical protein
MDHLYQIGVGEANGDVISAVGRHLAAETTSGLCRPKLLGSTTCDATIMHFTIHACIHTFIV